MPERQAKDRLVFDTKLWPVFALRISSKLLNERRAKTDQTGGPMLI